MTLQLRLIFYGLILGVIALLAVYAHHRIYQAGYDARGAQDAVAIAAQIAKNQATEEFWRKANDAAQQSYQAALEALRANAAAHPSPVVVCKRPAAAPVPGTGAPAGKPDAAATGSGVVPGDLRLDTGALYGLVDRADRMSEQLRALEASCR